MIEVERVIELLDEQRARLEKLAGEKIGSFYLVVPPEGDAVHSISMDSHLDPKWFFTNLGEKLKTAAGQDTTSQNPFIRTNR